MDQLVRSPPVIIQTRAEMSNSALPLNKLLAAHSNSLQLRLAAPRSLSAHDQRPGFLALPPVCGLAFFCRTT